MLSQFALASLLLMTSPISGLSEQLAGKLVEVAGYQLKPASLPEGTRWVVFYYTASWCPNCQAIKEPMVKAQSALEKMDAGICFVWVSLDRSAAEAGRYYAKSGYRGLAIRPGVKPERIPGAEGALEGGIPALRIYEMDGELWSVAADTPGPDLPAQLTLLQQAAQGQ